MGDFCKGPKAAGKLFQPDVQITKLFCDVLFEGRQPDALRAGVIGPEPGAQFTPRFDLDRFEFFHKTC